MVNRRTFLKQSSLLAGAAVLSPLNTFGNVSPFNILNGAVIGCRNQGWNDMKRFLNIPNVKCVALCDVDREALERKAATLLRDYGQKAAIYTDYRKLLEQKDIDFVIIATPDHWHCLLVVDSLLAGKHVYVEKPMAYSIEEANIITRLAAKLDCVVQVGQQRRSRRNNYKAIELIQSGKLGKLRQVNVWANQWYGIGKPKVPDTPAPSHVDYDMWIGPAKKRPFNITHFHNDWRQFWDFGGGLACDIGAHLLDLALWVGNYKLPKKVMAYGSQLSHLDLARETFDSVTAIMEMDDYVINWNSFPGTGSSHYNIGSGVEFVCDYGKLLTETGDQYEIFEGYKDDGPGKLGARIGVYRCALDDENMEQQHAQNFIDCILSGNKKTNCPPEIGRKTAMACHFVNIASRTGEILRWNEDKNLFEDAPEANKLIKPHYYNSWKLPNY